MDTEMRKERTEVKSFCWKKLSDTLKCRGWGTGPDTGNNVHKIRNTTAVFSHLLGSCQREQREENLDIVQTVVEQKQKPWQVDRR